MSSIKPKICFIVTSEMSVNAFLLTHLRALANIYDVTVITNTASPSFLRSQGVEANVIPLRIARQISIAADTMALFKLIANIGRMDYVSIHSVTPKAGLLAMLAGWVNNVPVRIHTFTGQVWANKSGLKRFLLKKIDSLIAAMATNTIIDSPTQKDFLIEQNVVKPEKCIVFGQGSIAGVDLKKFEPDDQTRKALREDLGLNENDCLFLFLGRLNEDKGVLDLSKAFMHLQPNEKGRATLMFVGPDEENMRVKIEQLPGFNQSDIRFVGFSHQPQRYMAAADCLCLPSYREGFGSVVIEAAAVGIPSVASRIYGISDAVIDCNTGLLHEPGDVDDIGKKLSLMLTDQQMRKSYGLSAQRRAKIAFNADKITNDWVNFYQELVS